jgi:putative component of toxin-antitoxin plasmid stabilization module
MDEVLGLPKRERRRVNERLKALGRKGWNAALADGTIKHLRDGIWEVRVLGTGAAYRLLFFPAPERAMRLVVVTTCAAKSVLTKRTRMEREIDRAISRRDQWIEQRLGGERWKAT